MELSQPLVAKYLALDSLLAHRFTFVEKLSSTKGPTELRFASLSRLSLKGNLLTAIGVRRMVLPCLVEGKAFASLSYLDLRENSVDGKAVVRVASSIASLQGRSDGRIHA